MSKSFGLAGYNNEEYREALHEYLSKRYPVTSLMLLFDEEKLTEEFYELDPKLQNILWYAAAYCNSIYNTPLVITHIFRSQEEQDEIYKDNPKYKENPWQSVHQFYRGADARLHDLGVPRAQMLAEHINALFPYKEGTDKKTVIVHDVGLGNHIHFQISY